MPPKASWKERRLPLELPAVEAVVEVEEVALAVEVVLAVVVVAVVVVVVVTWREDTEVVVVVEVEKLEEVVVLVGVEAEVVLGGKLRLWWRLRARYTSL